MENSDLTNLQVLDMRMFENAIGTEIELAQELFVLFNDTINQNIKRMKDSIKTGDFDPWKSSAHSLKGTAATIGAIKLSRFMDIAEKYWKESVKRKSDLLDRIEIEILAVKDLFRNKLKEMKSQ